MEDNKLYPIVHKMILVNKMHKQAIETVIDDIGIHGGRHRLLMNLAKRESVGYQKEIADELGITQAAMTVSLSKLEAEGLIRRVTGADNRYNEILITERGKEVVTLSKSHFSSVDKKTFQGISDEEIEIFEKCLDALYTNLNQMLGKDKK